MWPRGPRRRLAPGGSPGGAAWLGGCGAEVPGPGDLRPAHHSSLGAGLPPPWSTRRGASSEVAAAPAGLGMCADPGSQHTAVAETGLPGAAVRWGRRGSTTPAPAPGCWASGPVRPPSQGSSPGSAAADHVPAGAGRPLWGPRPSCRAALSSACLGDPGQVLGSTAFVVGLPGMKVTKLRNGLVATRHRWLKSDGPLVRTCLPAFPGAFGAPRRLR